MVAAAKKNKKKLQVGFMTERPVILMGEMWRGLLDWMRRDMVPRKLVNPEDLDLVRLSPSIDEAVAIIEAHKLKFDAAREMLILEARRAARAEKDPPPAVESVGDAAKVAPR